MNISKEQILESISNMSVMDIVDLTQLMKKKFNIQSLNNNETQEVKQEKKNKEEKKEFNITLTSYGNNKISVIKTIRSILNLGLKESKAFVENLPALVKSKISKPETDELKKKLEESGAVIEIK